MKKQTCVFLSVVMLLIGLSGGFVLSSLTGKQSPSSSVSASAVSSAAPRSDTDSTALLALSAHVLSALKNDDWNAFSAYVDPERGVTFTPHSTVDFTTDLTFTADALAQAEQDSTAYIWGVSADSSEPIRMTIADYFHTYIWDQDYTAAGEIGLDTIIHTGNAIENVDSAYKDCRFLDFYIPGSADSEEDWSALKLVFTWSDDQWYLVGIVHSGWSL